VRRLLPAPGCAVAGRDTRGHDDRVESREIATGHARGEREPDTERFDAPPEVAQGLVELLLAGDALGHVELAADLGCGVEEVTSCPRSAATVAHASPAGPAPTTAMRLRALVRT
jgi:hypothetical protein